MPDISEAELAVVEAAREVHRFQEENGAMGAIPFGVLMDAVARLKPVYEPLLTMEEAREVYYKLTGSPLLNKVCGHIGALYLRKAADRMSKMYPRDVLVDAMREWADQEAAL